MSGQPRKLLSVVIPVYNEEQNIEALYQSLQLVLGALAERYDAEIIFTDNHSDDGSFAILKRLAAQDRRVRVLRFSRNFGYQKSIYTGLVNARGDAAIQLDCDLQDPPRLILDFVRIWEGGYKVVYGVRATRQEGFWMNATRRAFYRLVNWLSEDGLPSDTGDFRLVDRRVLDELRKVDDAQPYLRGTIAVMGFDQVGVSYDRAGRARGQSKFRVRDLLNLGMDGIFNHSVVPLRLATYTGLVTAAATFIGMLIYTAGRLFRGESWPPGFATTTALLFISIGLNMLFIGIIGEYLGRIYRQVKKLPFPIVEQEISGGNPVAEKTESPV